MHCLRVFKIQLVIFLALLSHTAFAKSDGLTVATAHMSSMPTAQVLQFLRDKDPLENPKAEEFQKLELIFFGEPNVDRVTLESCEKAFQDGVDVYFNFDQGFEYVEPGKKLLTINARPNNLQSVTFNFRKNKNICLSHIAFYKGDHKLDIAVPEVAKAKFDNASTANLFDLNFRTYWTTVYDEAKPPSFWIQYPENFFFDSLAAFNGNELSEQAYKDDSRPRKINIICDEAPAETIELADSQKLQMIKLKKGYSCERVQMQVASVYAGRKIGALSLTEVWFFNDEHPLIADTSKQTTDATSKLIENFKKAGFEDAFRAQWQTTENGDHWIVRLRPDGTFFMRAFDDRTRENHSFYLVGDFSLQKFEKKMVVLHLHALRKTSPNEMDSLSCGRRCFTDKDFSDEKDDFVQDLEFRIGKDGFMRIDNVTPVKLRQLKTVGLRFKMEIL